TQDRIDRFKAEADMNCWSYHCNDGPTTGSPPAISIDYGVACMNEALASGASAMASMEIDVFNPWSTKYTWVFTVDHEVKVFTAFQRATEPLEDFRELPSCSGPFRVGPQICFAYDNTRGLIQVDGLAWDGCP